MTSPSPDRSPLDAPAAFAQLARLDLREESVTSVLQRVADLAVRVVPGADEVSVTLLSRDGGRPQTVACTGALAVDLDERQYEDGHGPCLHATASNEVVLIPDMAAEQRWPDWTPVARERGVGSSLTTPLPLREEVVAGLNMYSRRPDGFPPDSRELAATFASYAAVAVANISLHASTAQLASDLQTAMASRAVIEQAKGMLMARYGVDADTAFALLTRMSSHSNRKLRDIADDVVAGRASPT